MSIGFGQILVILLILFLLFGDVKKLMKDVTDGVNYFKNNTKDEKDKDKDKIESGKN